ncbi:MAG: hypothetical protein ABIR57_03715 [Aeromicrobium sp.]
MGVELPLDSTSHDSLPPQMATEQRPLGALALRAVVSADCLTPSDDPEMARAMVLTPKQRAMLEQLLSGVDDAIERRRIEDRFTRRMARKNRYAIMKVAQGKRVRV